MNIAVIGGGSTYRPELAVGLSAAAQLIASLHEGAGDVQGVDIRNDRALPNPPAAAVVEITARIDRTCAHALVAYPPAAAVVDAVALTLLDALLQANRAHLPRFTRQS